jgi:hypothetical protein
MSKVKYALHWYLLLHRVQKEANAPVFSVLFLPYYNIYVEINYPLLQGKYPAASLYMNAALLPPADQVCCSCVRLYRLE